MTPSEEARNFRRYAKTLGFTLRYKEKPIRAETVNYSLQGLGVLLEGRPPIKKGEILHIGHIELGNVGDATVAWTRPDEEGTLVGVSLIRPIEGCFRHFRFADIVNGFRKGRKTGTFSLTDSSGTKVFVKDGELIFATSDEKDFSLDRFLLKVGKLTEEQFYRAAEERWSSGSSEAATLVKLGYLKPAELVKAVKMQAEEIVCSIFSDDEFCFSFQEGVLPDKDLVTMKLPASNLIYRGLKKTQNSRILEQYSPSVDDVIRFAASQEEFWSVTLDEEDRRILTLVDGRRRLGEILKLSPFGEKATIRSICALLGSGVVVVADVIEEAVTEASEPPVEILETPKTQVEKDKAALRFREGKRYFTLDHFNVALKLFDEAISLDPSDSRYYLFRGKTLRRLGRGREAGEAISVALRLDPTNTDIIDELNSLKGKAR